MKKIFKQILSVIVIILIVVSLTNIYSSHSAKADVDTYPAFKFAGTGLNFNATIKCYGNFYGWDVDTPEDSTATVHVSDYGEYSVSFVAPTTVANLSEMSGSIVVQTDLSREPASYPFILSAKTVRIDSKLYGKSYDWSKATAYLDNGSVKMSVHNEWSAQEKDNPLAGKVISINKGETVTFTFEVKEDPLAAERPTEAPTEQPAQYYSAYLGFQTDKWDYREAYEKDFNAKEYNFVNQAVVGGKATDTKKVKIENAKITGNGTYSVSMTGADLSGGTKFQMLYISTDIPTTFKNVKFSNIKVTIDGTVAATLKDGVIKKEVQDGTKKYYIAMAVNEYGEAGIDMPEKFQYKMPKNSLKLQFSIDFEGNHFGNNDDDNNNNNLPATKKSQTIQAKSYTKTYGSKAFSLKATTNGNGKLSYTVSNKKVATVSSVGKVTIKGYGKATITIKASETGQYKSATKKVSITVIPKAPAEFVVMSSPDKMQYAFKWTLRKDMTGYQIWLSTDKNFKKNIKSWQVNGKTSSITCSASSFVRKITYYVRVRAYKKVGNTKYYSKWSKIKHFKRK